MSRPPLQGPPELLPLARVHGGLNSHPDKCDSPFRPQNKEFELVSRLLASGRRSCLKWSYSTLLSRTVRVFEDMQYLSGPLNAGVERSSLYRVGFSFSVFLLLAPPRQEGLHPGAAVPAREPRRLPRVSRVSICALYFLRGTLSCS